MASRLTLRIQERMARLTKSEQRIGQLILGRPQVIDTNSATDLARMAGVSKATAARFFRSLGYADFDEVKTQAREERNRTEPFQYSLAASEKVVLGRAIGDHLNLELANLTRTFEELRSDKLSEAAELIADAPRLWILGLGLEEGLARHARVLFSRLRHNVMLLGMNDGAWAEDLAMTGPRDVLILITIDPRPRILKAIIGYARTTRVTVITITDHSYFAQAQRFSRVVLPCHVTSFGLIPSSTPIASVLRLLAISVIGHDAQTALQRMDIITAIHEELDDVE